MAGHWSKHRFKIFNATQHPYRHVLSEFAYTNNGLPGVSNVEQAMDWMLSVFYPLTQSAVGLKTDLPVDTAITFDATTGKIVGAPAAFNVGDLLYLTSTGTLPTSYAQNLTYKVTAKDITGLTVTTQNGTPISWISDDGAGTHTLHSIENAYRVVFDDGDGKAASYRWEQREGDLVPKWYKIYDMDWSEDSILAQFQNITQDLYVYKNGKNDTDENGIPYAGAEAGQHIYGGATANTNLTLHANSGDAVGVHTGEIRTDDNVVPTVDNLLDIGKLVQRYKELFLSLAANIDTMKIESGKITDSTGNISFDNENLSTTGDLLVNDVTATGFVNVDGAMNLQAGQITDTTGAISFDDENLITTGEITAKKFNLSGGGSLGEKLDGTPIFSSPTGKIDFNNLTLENILKAIITDLEATTAKIGNFDISGSNILTITPADVTINAGVGFKVVIAPKLETTDATVTGTTDTNILTVQTDATINDDLSVLGDTNTKNINIDGTVTTPGAELVFLKDIDVPNIDVAGNTTTDTLNVNTSVVLGAASTVSDGTNTHNASDILDFPYVAANQDDVPHWDTATSKYIAKPIDFPDHGELLGLSDDDHAQYALLAGRTGGQTLAGSNAANPGNLTLIGQAGAAGANKIIASDKVVPDTTDVRDLGSATEKWKDVYTSGEFKGLRLENVAALPAANVANIGRAVFVTSEQKAYIDLGGTWKAIGSGAGGESSNIIVNGDAEDLSFNTFEANGYDDGVGQAEPLIGGVINTVDLSTSISTTNPLNGLQVYRLQKTNAASNWQGKGFRTKTISIPLSKRGKLFKASFDFLIDAPTVTTCPFKVYFYDITNSKLVYPSNLLPTLEASGVVSSYQGEVQFDLNTTQVRMLLHFYSSTTGQLVDIRLDDLKLKTNEPSNVTNSTSWETFVPAAGGIIKSFSGSHPTFGGIVYNLGRKKFSADEAEIDIEFRQSSAGSAGGAGAYYIDLAALGLAVDVSKLTTNNSVASQLDFGPGLVGEFKGFHNDSGFRAEGGVYVYDSTRLKIAYIIVNNSTGTSGYNVFGSGGFQFSSANMSFSIKLKFPVVGRTAVAKASDGYDGRALVTQATRASAAITSGADITGWSISKDNAGAFNVSTGQYSVKSSGDYVVFIRGILPTSGSVAIGIYKNGTNVANGNAAVAGSTRGQAYALVSAVVGDTLSVRGDASVTLGSEAVLEIFKLQSPQVVTSGEKVALRYTSTSGATIGTTDATYVFGARTFDTHLLYNNTTGEFTANSSGLFKINAQLTTTYSAAASTLYVRIYKNGALYSGSYVTAPAGSVALTRHEDYIQLVQGDVITIRASQNVSAAASSVAGINFVNIERV